MPAQRSSACRRRRSWQPGQGPQADCPDGVLSFSQHEAVAAAAAGVVQVRQEEWHVRPQARGEKRLGDKQRGTWRWAGRAAIRHHLGRWQVELGHHPPVVRSPDSHAVAISVDGQPRDGLPHRLQPGLRPPARRRHAGRQGEAGTSITVDGGARCAGGVPAPVSPCTAGPARAEVPMRSVAKSADIMRSQAPRSARCSRFRPPQDRRDAGREG